MWSESKATARDLTQRGFLKPAITRAVILRCAQDERLCEKASGAIASQAPQHGADHGERDPGFFTAGEQFVVFCQTPPGAEPGKGAFHHPAPRQHLETA